MKPLLLLSALAVTLVAQTSSNMSITATAPTGVTISTANTIGIPEGGGSPIYYFVMSRFPGGFVGPSRPAVAQRTYGPEQLSGGAYVRVLWIAAPGATGYDVIRSKTPNLPALPCTSCAVVLNTSSTSVDDTGGAMSNYPPVGITVNGRADATFTVNNVDESTPFINLRILKNSVETVTRLLELSGTPAENDCLKFSGGRAVSAGAACGSGSGSTYTIGFGLSLIGDVLGVDFGNVPGLAASNLYSSVNDFSTGTFRNTTGAGIPSAGTCNEAGHVGKLYTRNDAAAANASVYSCNLIGVATYGWELLQSSGSSTITNEVFYPIAACNNGVGSYAGANWVPDGLSPAPCQVGSAAGGYYLAPSGSPTAYLTFPLPTAWTGNVDIKFLLLEVGAGTGTVRLTAETSCYDTGTGKTLAYNSPQQADISLSSTNKFFTGTISALTATGCSAGNMMVVRVKRDNTVGGNYGDYPHFLGARITTRHN